MSARTTHSCSYCSHSRVFLGVMMSTTSIVLGELYIASPVCKLYVTDHLFLFAVTANPICPSSFTPPVGEMFCPGEEITCYCNSFDTTSIVPTFRWSGFCPDGSAINIRHGISGQDSGMCGPFSVQATDSDGDCYTSTLTVTASPELNGTLIQCSHLGAEVGNTTLLVAGRSMCFGLVELI